MKENQDVQIQMQKNFLELIPQLQGVNNSHNTTTTNTHNTQNFNIQMHSLKEVLSIAETHDKRVVVYLSMAFGNPYGEPWELDLVSKHVDFLVKMGVKVISLSDTIGIATNDKVGEIFKVLTNQYTSVEFGAHLHILPTDGYDKINEAYKNGCRRFDGVIMGYGGCPMASNKLMGNLPTEKILNFIESKNINSTINPLNFESAYNFSKKVFN